MSTTSVHHGRAALPRGVWLGLGFVATAFGHMRWGIDALAWLAPIAWLRYLSLDATSRAFGRVLLVQLAAWSVVVLGIVTDPVPLAMAFVFAVPIALMSAPPYFVWAWLRRRGTQGRGWSSLAFACAVVVAETLAHRLTPFGVWGHGANAALHDLPLMQLAALTGASGISFVLSWAAAALVARLSEGAAAPERRQLWLAGAALLAAHVYGELRLDLASARARATVTLAAVGTDSDISGLPLPSDAQRRAWDRALVERTERAARAGAQLVVWTEAAAVVLPGEEQDWLGAVGELARRERVAIVAGYVVPRGEGRDFHYENAYALLRPDGGLEHRYLKHHPVPGEPALRGTGPIPVWSSEVLGPISGAICYDYDFPASALARAGVGLVALPSSDWRGIDPIHTHMARLRAIEGGHALLRSTRYGLSAGIDALGVVHGQLSSFDSEVRVLVVELPLQARATLYARWGEWFALLCALLLAGLGWATRRA